MTPKKGKKLDVAVKQNTNLQSREEREKFLREARQMRLFIHPNIIKMIGIAAAREPLLIVMELAPGGSLQKRLEKHGKQTPPQEKIRYCLEAARGMEYLEKWKCIHRDVAARNCLLGAKDVVKIADFGLSHVADMYRVTTQKKLPIRWLSPETMRTSE